MGSKLPLGRGHKDDQNTHSVISESKPMPMTGLVLAFPGAAPDAWSKPETQGRTCDRLGKMYLIVFVKSCINRETGKRDFCMPVKLNQVCIWHLADWSDSLQTSQPPGSTGESLVSQ